MGIEGPKAGGTPPKKEDPWIDWNNKDEGRLPEISKLRDERIGSLTGYELDSLRSELAVTDPENRLKTEVAQALLMSLRRRGDGSVIGPLEGVREAQLQAAKISPEFRNFFSDYVKRLLFD